MSTARSDASRRTRSLRRVAAVILAGGLAVSGIAGCSSNDSPKRRLEAATQQVRNAAAGGNFSDLRQAVSQLRTQVQSQAVNGDISAQDEQAILDAAQAVLDAARPRQTTPSSAATTTPTSQPPTTSEPPPTSVPPTTTTPTTAPPTTPTTTHPTSTPPNSSSNSNSGGALNGDGAASGHGGQNSSSSSASNSNSAPAG